MHFEIEINSVELFLYEVETTSKSVSCIECVLSVQNLCMIAWLVL